MIVSGTCWIFPSLILQFKLRYNLQLEKWYTHLSLESLIYVTFSFADDCLSFKRLLLPA